MKRFIFILTLFTILVACGGSTPEETAVSSPTAAGGETAVLPTETAAPATATTAPTPSVDTAPTAQPSSTPVSLMMPEPIQYVTSDGELIEQAPPLLDFVDLWQQGVALGWWTEGDGLTRILGYALNEAIGVGLPQANEVLTHDLGHLYEAATEFLAASPNAAQAAEIRRQLRAIYPDAETLALLSVPEAEANQDSGGKTAVVAKPAAQAAGGELCVSLATRGYPQDEITNLPCYAVREVSAGGQMHRVYYPTSWLEAADKLQIIEATVESLTKSMTLYQSFGEIQTVNLLFSIRADPDDANSGQTLGAQISFEAGQACPVIFYPAGFQESSGQFKQTVAHELFHCVQSWNFTPTPEEIHEWWLEGTAEYFSNLVYPTVNDEHRRLNAFNVNSRNLSLFDMDYENFLFFQFLGNRIGDAAIWQLITAVSTQTSVEGMRQTLAGSNNMGQLFQDFVLDFLSEGIADTGGGQIVTRPAATDTKQINDEQTLTIETEAFVATRYILVYKKERRFVQELESVDIYNFSAVPIPQRTDRTRWTLPPEEVRSSCREDSKFGIAVTTVEQNYTFKMTLPKVERATCDPCVLGLWQVNNASFAGFLQDIIANAPEIPEGYAPTIKVVGQQTVRFKEDGRFATERNQFGINFSIPNVGTGFNNSITGRDEGSYQADGERLSVYSVREISNSVTANTGNGGLAVTLPGNGTATFSLFGQSETVDTPNLSSNDSLPPPLRYSCMDETLTVTLQTGFKLQLDRLERPEPTPEPTPEPDPTPNS